MTRLDADEREARRPREVEGVPADVAVRYLRELSTTWRKADGGPGRRMLAEALFSRIEILGGREATIHLANARTKVGAATTAQLVWILAPRLPEPESLAQPDTDRQPCH